MGDAPAAPLDHCCASRSKCSAAASSPCESSRYGAWRGLATVRRSELGSGRAHAATDSLSRHSGEQKPEDPPSARRRQPGRWHTGRGGGPATGVGGGGGSSSSGSTSSAVALAKVTRRSNCSSWWGRHLQTPPPRSCRKRAHPSWAHRRAQRSAKYRWR
eukprot:11161483-Lingulodinium_polyedra.AAC.1